MCVETSFQQIGSNLPSLLIINDSDDIVEIISELFSDEYNCIKAADGQEGVAIAEEIIPNIILCDVQMQKNLALTMSVNLKTIQKLATNQLFF